MTIACSLRWGIASVGRFSIGRGSHPIRENISGAEQTSVNNAYSGRNCEESRHVAFNNLFVKCFGTI